MDWLHILITTLIAALAYLIGETAASRCCGYGAESPFWTLGPYWIVKAWLRR